MLKSARKFFIAATVVGSSLAFISVVVAQSAGRADVIKARQQHLKDVGAAYKTIRDQLRLSASDATAIKVAAVEIQTGADAMPNWFPQGSGPEVGVKTAAKPEIWSDPMEFIAAQKNFAEVAGKFAHIAKGGDIDAVKAQFGSLGQACKRCHDKYRVKEN